MQIASFDGQKKGEKIVGAWRGHPWIMSRAGFIFALLVIIGSIPWALWHPSWSAGFLLFFLAVGGIYLILQIFIYLNTLYILTSERVIAITQNKILMRTINEVPLHNIQNVSHMRKGLFQMIMNYGDVEIQTAGSSVAMKIQNIPDPYKVQQKILAKEQKEVDTHFSRE